MHRERRRYPGRIGGEIMPWLIQVWIPVELEKPQTYLTKQDADRDIESLKLMSPENVYEAVEQ